MKIKIILLLLFCGGFSSSQAQSADRIELAKRYSMDGVMHMEAGKLDSAIDAFNQAFRLNPNEINYQYQKSLALYRKGEYKPAIKILRALLLNQEAGDNYYQLLGGCYRGLARLEDAEKVYRAGLLKYPESGRLYLELGIMQNEQGYPEKAIGYFEQGIELTPTYASNYYWAAKHWLESETPIWGLFYGEIFLNLERHTVRSYEMSAMLFEAWKNGLNVLDDDDLEGLDFDNAIGMDPIEHLGDKSKNQTFSTAFENQMNVASVSLIGITLQDLYIQDLNTVRNNFIIRWNKEGLDRDFPNPLITWWRQLYSKGVFDAYNYWVFNQGRFNEFEQWYSGQSDYYTQFFTWFKSTGMPLDKRNLFLRTSVQ